MRPAFATLNALLSIPNMMMSLLETERTRQPGASDGACVRAIAARVIGELEIVEPPVDVEMIASYLGVNEVILDDQLVEAGCLACLGSRLEVRVRASDLPTRQRFTICHECGHTFFPGFARQTRFRCTPGAAPASTKSRASAVGAARQLEQLCDLAASELLLPQQIFVPEARGSVFDLSSVALLAERYEASLEATARRFVAAQSEPSALVILQVVQKPTERGSRALAKLRVTSSLATGSWPFIPLHKSVQVGSPFDRALQGELVHEMAVIKDLFKTPQHVEVSAELFPWRLAGQLEPRVMALLRRPAA